jgi:hypothetical protein
MFFGSDRFHHIAHCLGMKNPATFLQILITVTITMQYMSCTWTLITYHIIQSCFFLSIGVQWPIADSNSKL